MADDEAVHNVWLTSAEVKAQYGLDLGVANGDPRDPCFVLNKLDAQLHRLWLQSAVESLATRTVK